MSFAAIAWALDAKATLTGKSVLLAMAARAGDGGRCWPSLSRLCLDTCMSERAARAAIGSLVAAGLIAREERTGTSAVYTLAIGETPASDAPRQEMPPRHHAPLSPASDAPLPGATCPPPRHVEPPTPASGAPKSSLNVEEKKQEVESAPASPPLPAAAATTIDPKPEKAPKGTRLPADWQPDATDCAVARGLGLDPHAVAPKYRDYWIANGHRAMGRKSDWPATWRNWCRTEAERRAARPQGRPTSADNRAAAGRALFPDGFPPGFQAAAEPYAGGIVIDMPFARTAGARQ